MGEQEGVIKFSAQRVRARAPCLTSEQLAVANRVRSRLLDAGMMGCDAERYGGLGFGNLSWRPTADHSGFFITGSQTGHLAQLGIAEVVWVDTYDLPAHALNYVSADASAKPSSESLSHAAVYAQCASACAVIHVHAPAIWYHAAALGLPHTAADVPYGTPAMATALQCAWQDAWQEEWRETWRETRHSAGQRKVTVVVMKGHQDGVIASGPNLDEVLQCLLALQKQASVFSESEREAIE